MKNEKEELTKDSFTPGGYAWFHFFNKGKEFFTPDGVKSKLEIWQENKRDHNYMRLISEGKISDVKPIDKKDWKDGVFLGWHKWDIKMKQVAERWAELHGKPFNVKKT